jgi:predicted O-linked N-acetylglucosamine transferase (SPINDLY family)
MTNPAATRFTEQFARAQLLQQQGQLPAARLLYQEILDAEPDHFDTLNAMGVLAGQSNDLQQAIRYFDRAIAVEPGNSGAQCNRGLALKQLNQPDAALECFNLAIALDAQSAIAHYSRAETCRDLGRPDEAVASYDRAIAVNPGFVQASYRRGLLLQQIGRLEDAIAGYDHVIQIKSNHFDAHANRAFVLYALGRLAEALASCDEAVALKADQAPLHSFRGDVLRALDRPEAALASYDRAISINPDDAEAHCNRGAVLLLLEKVEAIASFDRAIAIRPDYAQAYFYRGYSRHKLSQFDLATTDYKVVAGLAPDYDLLPGTRLETSLQVCDWSDFETLARQVAAGVEQGKRVAHPFILTALTDSPRLQQKAARAWVNHACPANDALGPISSRGRPGKLRIGYFSADFREHPLGRLLAELIEIHDRSRFEIIGFSFGPKTDDALQRRYVRAFDRFIDVRERSSLEIASLARSLEIDIAVDLTGHTLGNRTKIFALRAAPVQMHYLGYLGTMGADYMDYIVADATVVTPESEPHFSEKIIYLPDTHQVNDRQRVVADEVFTRDELDLPPTGFVFCCFNTSYKLLPATFAGWMRILRAVPESVLLLYARNETTEINLRAHAAEHGIDPRRLIFGARLALPEYLARYRTADLFLDTFPYTAGTTASDALWAGLPVLTLTGESFVSRTAASLLRAIGAPELVASTQQQYEQLAIELALNPQRLAEIRGKIQNNRDTSPLFDTPRFARNLEVAYMAVHERHQAGLPPDHVRSRAFISPLTPIM